MQKWKRVEPTKTYKAGYRTIVEKQYIMPDGSQFAITTIDPEGSAGVAVIALTPDNRVVVARQFRAGPELIMDELPGGFVDKGEELAVAAARELKEETGYQAEQLEYLGESRYDAYYNRRRHYFLARNCTLLAAPQLGEHEYVEQRLISIDALIDAAKSGRMTDPGAVLLAYETLVNCKEKDA